jgi:hypothetical protein
MMKAILRFCAPLVALCCAPSLVAAPYPTADQMRLAIQDVSAHLKAEKMEVEILDARKDRVKHPLMAAGLRLGDGICIVYVNDVVEPRLEKFFGAVAVPDMQIWLNSIALHEVAHCIEQREAYIRRRFDLVLPPGLPRENVTVQGYFAVVKSGTVETWGEAFADIVSVLYLREAVPERWAQFANSLVALRSDLAQKWPEHDTSAFLRAVIAGGASRPPERSLFDTAFELRRLHDPASAGK